MSRETVEEKALAKYEKELEKEIAKWEKIVFSDALTQYAKYLSELSKLSQSFDHRTATSAEYKKFLARFRWLENAVDIYRKQAVSHQDQAELAQKKWSQAKFDLDELRFKLGYLRHARERNNE